MDGSDYELPLHGFSDSAAHLASGLFQRRLEWSEIGKANRQRFLDEFAPSVSLDRYRALLPDPETFGALSTARRLVSAQGRAN